MEFKNIEQARRIIEDKFSDVLDDIIENDLEEVVKAGMVDGICSEAFSCFENDEDDVEVVERLKKKISGNELSYFALSLISGLFKAGDLYALDVDVFVDSERYESAEKSRNGYIIRFKSGKEVDVHRLEEKNCLIVGPYFICIKDE